ncbi:MAG: hypothetical protein M1814_006625 [Vezdaea aestivalis]|nr:MAG: hypothetical protein M1814_006625 [Vezdaea aestivalis]
MLEKLGRPHWTVPIQTKDTLLRLEDFRSSGRVPPNWSDNTIKVMQTSLRYWKRYCEHIQEDPLESLKRAKAPDFINWLDWIIRSSRKKTKTTLDTYWKLLCEYYGYNMSLGMEQSVMTQVRRVGTTTTLSLLKLTRRLNKQYINGKMLKGGNVSQRARRKDTLSPEDLGILLKTLWVYDETTRPHERMRVQESVLDALAYISGSRPGVMLAQDYLSHESPFLQSSSTEDSMASDRSSQDNFISDLPDRVGLTEPQTVCYRDIELFIIRNPEESERDVVAAVIEFRNLKGRPEGADGTKFFLHCDYQLVYCPITFILALAFADNAFKSELITPDYLLRVKVPSRLHTLPIHWKTEILDKPIFRRLRRDSSGIGIDDSLPLSYRYGNDAIHRLGELAGYRHSIKFYCFRRWTANTLNKNVTEQERNRTLGHGGSQVYLKHYHDNFVRFDIQSMVLMRPSQDRLIQAASEMRKDRDPLAPRHLKNHQKEEIRCNSYLRQLRTENRLLLNEIHNKYAKLSNAKETELGKEYIEKQKEIDRVRKILDREMLQAVKENYRAEMPTMELDKQIEQMMRKEDGNPDQSNSDESDSGDNEPWNPPIPQYHFPERARLCNAFFGPEAETMTGDSALLRRVQVIKDLTSLCQLREPPRRRQPFKWNKNDIEDGDENKAIQVDQDIDTPPAVSIHVSCDQCIFCRFKEGFNDVYQFARTDSAWRHVESMHLSFISSSRSLPCPHPSCQTVKPFYEKMSLLSHMVHVHHYCKDKYSLRRCSRNNYAALDRGD